MSNGSSPHTLTSIVKVYVRGPQTDWAQICVDQFGSFAETLTAVKKKLAELKPENLRQIEKYPLKLTLVGGGLIERNQAITDGDKLVAVPVISKSELKKQL